MIEIFALLYLAGKIGRIVEAKGYAPLRYRVTTILLWFIGEFLGFLVGMRYSSSVTGFYIFALGGAILGALVSYRIANGLPNLQPPQNSLTP